MTDRDKIEKKLLDVPPCPGVYIFRDAAEHVLYVGKAKQLRNRLRSYFQQSANLDRRKTEMVRRVRDLEYIVTANELEAFVLEATLIKRHRPRYNVLLRDDKSYPYLKLTVQEEWPRLEVVRRIRNDGARYYGPYVPSGPMWNILSFVRKNFRLPPCRHSFEKRLRPCIQHQIGRCDAPCAGLADRAEYLRTIGDVRLILEGKNAKIISDLERRMEQRSRELRYEEAAEIRDRIAAVRQLAEQQNVVSPGLEDLDVFGLARSGSVAVCKVLFVRGGVLVGSRDLRAGDGRGESDGEFIGHMIEQFYERELIPPPEILCSVMPADDGMLAEWLGRRKGSRVKIAVPRRGTKHKLLVMAEENALILSRVSIPDDSALLEELAERLSLPKPPSSIGAFDISNISGSLAVGAFVWWEHGSFRKDRYRQVTLDGVQGPDDFAMMREAVRRVVRNLTGIDDGDGNGSDGKALPGLPDLFIIDGGRAHLDAACSVLAEIGIDAETVSVAKDPDRLFSTRKKAPLRLTDGKSSSLLLLKIRDEVHRFALSQHRARRGRMLRDSVLDSIYGIGRKRRFALLEHFGSIDAIRNADPADIARIPGFTRELAERVHDALTGRTPQKESS